MATNLTRINNNQITDASTGNVYVGVNAASKIQNYTVTSQKLANNITYNSDLQITGNLTVSGTTTTVDTVNTLIEDPLIVLASGQTTGTPTVDIGYIGLRGADNNIALAWKESDSKFVAAFTTTDAGNSYSNTTFTIASYADFEANNITANGTLTVTGTTSFVGNIISANITNDLTAANVYATTNISAAGNVLAGTYFVGDGAYISNINAGNVSTYKIFNGGSYANISAPNGNLVIAIGSGSNLVATFYDTGVILDGNVSVTGSINVQDSLNGANLSLTGNVDSNLKVTQTVTGGNVVGVTLVSSGGNVSASSFLTGANLSLSGNVDGALNVTQTVTGGNVVGVTLVSSGGNVTASSFLTGANLSLSGNVDGPLNVTQTVTGGNVVGVTLVSSGGNVTASSFLTGANLSLSGNVDGALNVTQTVTGGNIVGVTLVSSGGNVSASSFLTGANLSLSGNVDGALNVGGNVTGGNLIAVSDITAGGTIYAGVDVSAGSNVVGGNINTGGNVSAGGNITGGNIITTGPSGNISGANVISSTTMSATGNVYGGNIISQLAVTAVGDITGGNIYTANVVSAGGNVIGGNINTGNIVSAGGNVFGGNIYATSSGDISTAGNVYAGTSVNTPNVVASMALALTANSGDVNISATGNIGVSGLYINNLHDPVQNQDAATKYYVDTVAQGLTVIASTYAVAAIPLANISGGTVTYNNGNAGVGANLVTTGTYSTIDGVNIAVANTRILVTGQANAVQNGVYLYTSSTVLTRSTDYDVVSEIQPGDFVFNQYGNAYGNTQWVQTANVTTIGTSPITFIQFGGAGTYTAGNGIVINGVVISARVDNNTLDFSGTGNLEVKAGANLITPNIGNATGNSISVDGNITGGNLFGVTFISSGGNVTASSFLTGANLSLSGNVDGPLNVTQTVTGGNLVGVTLVSSGGNVSASSFLTGANLSLSGNVDGNLNVTASVNGGNLVGVTLVSSGGNISASSFLTGANLSLSGNVDGNLNVTASVNGGNLVGVTLVSSGGNVSASSFLTGANLSLSGNVDGALNVGGNVTGGNLIAVTDISSGGNILSTGYVSALGNITTANYFVGDGGYISNINAANVATTKIFNGGSYANVTSPDGNVVIAVGSGSNTVATFYDTGVDLNGPLSVGGNITGGNISTSGSGGNITGANVISGTTLTAGGNVYAGTALVAGNITIPSSGNINAGTNYINNVIDPVQSQDAATKGYVDGYISGGITISDGANTTALALNGTLSLIGTSNQVTVAITATDVVTFSLPTNISVAGNVTAGNVNAGNVNAGNIVISGDNITDTNGRVNFNSALSSVDFAVNGTAANVFYVSASGNSASFGNSTQTVNALVAFNSSTSIVTPVGNTNQRPPTGVTGMMRFNSTLNALEIYNNTQWQTVGSTVFTVIADEQFAGDGSTVQFTLGSTQTTNSVIVSINGVLQIPTTAYSVSGVYPSCYLTFTEAPEPGDTIDVREITTTTTVNSITNSAETATLLADPTYAQIDITGNLIPTSNVLQTLGNATNQWKSLYVSGNTIYLGGLQLQASGNTFAVYQSDGSTPATLDVGNIDVSSITAGTSSLGFRGTNGNAFITVNGTANVLTATTAGVNVLGNLSVSGNITGNFNLDSAVSASGNVIGGNVLTGGLISAAGGLTGANLTITGYGTVSTGGNIIANINISAGANVISGNVLASGLISATGNVIGGNILFGTGVVSGTGQVNAATVSTTGNITASYFIGNGYALTSINGANVVGLNTAAITNGTSNVNIAVSNGNITAGVGGTPNVAVIATTGVSVAGTVQANGTITGGNLSAGSGYVSTTGNVTGGNVLFGSGVVSGTGTVYAATVNAATIGNTGAVHNGATVSVTGNVTGGNVIVSGVLLSTNTISATGNVTGGYFVGDGSQLSNIAGANVTGNVSSATTAYNANLATVSNNQEYRPVLVTSTSGNLPFKASSGISWNPSTYALTAGKILLGSGIGAQGTTGKYAFGGNTSWAVQSQNGTGTDAQGQEIGRFGSEYTSGATVYWDSYVTYYQGSGANSGWMILNAAGNAVANVTGAGIAVTGTLSASGNITGGNISIGSGSSTAGSYSASGNITGGNVLFGSGVVSGTGNINGANLTVSGGFYNGNISIVGANIVSAGPTLYIDPNGAGGTDGNVIITGNLTVQGTTTTINSNTVTTNDLFINVANNASTAAAANGGGLGVGPIGSEYASLLYSSAANSWQTSIALSVTGTVQASGNITGGNLIAGSGIITTTGNITGGNVLFGSGVVSGTGTITGGNLAAGSGYISSSGNVTGGNVIYGTGVVSGTGTVYAATVNAATIGNTGAVHNGTTVSVTGNVTGGNLIASGVLISTNTISVAGNITGGNISVGSGSSTAGSYSASGNVTGGNILTNGLVSAGAGVFSASVAGNSISTAGNVAGGYLFGNASFVTGLSAFKITNGTSYANIATSNGNIAFAVNGTGIVNITANGIENAQANTTGNIGTASNYFNTVFAKATSAQYADLAEMYTADAEYAPGTVVSFGGDAEVTLSNSDADPRIAGVVSTNPSYLMNAGLDGDIVVAIALTGRVPCSVIGPVRKGDMMVSAGNGQARAEANPVLGTVIGKALEDFDGDTGVIEVVVGRL